MPPDASAEAASAAAGDRLVPSAADGAAVSAPDAYQQSGKWGHNQTLLHSTMDVTRSVASPSEDIKKAAVFEKDALLSAQTMIYVRGRRPAIDAT